MERETIEYDKERELEPAPRETRSSEAAHRLVQPKPKSGFRRLLILGAILALAAAGVYLWVHSLNRVSTDDAQVDGHIVPVSSKIYGKISEVLVDDNQQVKQGQILARIDARDYQVKVDQGQAAIVVAQSQSQGADAGVPLVRETTSSDVSGAEAQLR